MSDERSGRKPDREPYAGDGHLTVQRPVNDGTNLVEVWVFGSLLWREPDGEYDFVNCHITHVNDLRPDGLPPVDARVTDQTRFAEVPDDVIAEFIAETDRFSEAVDRLVDGAMDARSASGSGSGGDA